MTSFSNLSNELILMIWNFAEVEDIYNFSTVSKRVYLLVCEALREHCKLTKRLSIISNVDTKSGESGPFGRILKEVLLNPRAARYPSLLKIGRWVNKWDSEVGNTRGRVPECDLKLFKQAARDNLVASEAELQEDWLPAIDQCDEEPLIALLLLLLPNLRKIQFCSMYETCFLVNHALIAIVYEGYPSLRKLRTVDLRCAAAAGNNCIDFELVRLFARLPSVTCISGQLISTSEDDITHASSYDVSQTNVISLSFERCCISPKVLFEFISSSRSLEHFSYIPEESTGNRVDFDPFWIRSVLLTNARETLKTLTVLAGGQDRVFMGHLKNFTRLESVQSDLRLLIGDPSRSAHTLSEMLPLSIINIWIHIDYSSDAAYYKDSIQNISDNPCELPRLETIEIMGVPDVRAAELSHESLVRVLEGRRTRLSFRTEKWPLGIEDGSS